MLCSGAPASNVGFFVGIASGFTDILPGHLQTGRLIFQVKFLGKQARDTAGDWAATIEVQLGGASGIRAPPPRFPPLIKCCNTTVSGLQTVVQPVVYAVNHSLRTVIPGTATAA